ncbi:YigZ family protein [Ferruginibacter sp. HRS2-29]|uniref:IMPACT family protein n=1 Tax=Ferruginibacter sp. HRS2-29 TaxID=2487334 RepID=UPI0020CF336C|nr:YigZ family protein [Ferruginibacter sp. HRS2-29]MCP9753242.1 YigZ family protein [Ferruginibacter sp. HRS2-29]
MEFYNTIEQSANAEFKERGSRFIGYAYPVVSADEFKKHLQQLKKEHAKAVHHCFAYRIGIDGNTFRSSDDGEPSGTAGKPILGQIDSKGVTDTAIIVVRYFGGTLLGVPGLINAYKTTAALVLQVVPTVQKPVLKHYRLHFDYTRMNEVMMILKQYQCVIFRQESQLFCEMEVGIPLSRLEEVKYKIDALLNVEILNIV